MNKVMQSLVAKIELDRTFDRKTYKKAKKVYLAKLGLTRGENIDKFLLSIANIQDAYQVKRDEYAKLAVNTVKPSITTHQAMESNKKAIEAGDQAFFSDDNLLEIKGMWLAYENYRDLSRLDVAIATCQMVFDAPKKQHDKLIDGIFELYMDSLGSKWSGEFVIDALAHKVINAYGIAEGEFTTLGYIINALKSAQLFTVRKHKNIKNKGTSWYIKTKFEDYEDVLTLRKLTSKKRVQFVHPDDVTANDWIISNSKYNYPQKTMAPALMSALNKKNKTMYAFADWVTADDIADAVRSKLYSDKAVSNSWIEKEVQFAVAEFNDIKKFGNMFYVLKFLDSALRIYEHKNFFGLQESKSFRQMIRFYNKEVVTPEGRAEYKAQLDEEYGEGQWQQMHTHEDKWGWLEAYRSRTKPTGAIVYDDATSQVIGLYGLGTGSDNLLSLGGFNNVAGFDFRKGYVRLAELMNAQLTDLIGENITCFTGSNLKNAFMTSLYNVSITRVLTGRSGMDEQDKINEMLEEAGMPEMISEYESDTSKLGKLEPLLMTVREAGLDIKSEYLATAYNFGVKALARDALAVMEIINGLVVGNEDTEIFEWTLPDGAVAQFAMVERKEEQVVWLDVDGQKHSFTHYYKTLTPGVAWRGLAPRIIQSLDAYLMRYVTNYADFDIGGIHDSFGSHGNHAKAKRDIYLAGAACIYQFDALGSIISEIKGTKVSIQNLRQNRQATINRILGSSNAITK